MDCKIMVAVRSIPVKRRSPELMRPPGRLSTFRRGKRLKGAVR